MLDFTLVRYLQIYISSVTFTNAYYVFKIDHRQLQDSSTLSCNQFF